MGSFNGDFPPWRCSGRQRKRGERRRHPLRNKPWKKELHHQDEPWIRSLEGCFNGGKERGREREEKKMGRGKLPKITPVAKHGGASLFMIGMVNFHFLYSFFPSSSSLIYSIYYFFYLGF